MAKVNLCRYSTSCLFCEMETHDVLAHGDCDRAQTPQTVCTQTVCAKENVIRLPRIFLSHWMAEWRNIANVAATPKC